jgi:hypothetical protein
MQNGTFKLALTLGIIFSLQQQVAAQDEAKKSDKKAKQEMLVRPEASVGPSVDGFTAKAFDVYDESVNISQALEFVKVETKEVADKGDGVTTEVKISDGKGGALTKMGALTQLGDLLLRTAKQTENIAAVQALQPAATQEMSSISPMAKMKAAKAMGKGADALAFALGETKKQGSLIQQQISTLKALKNN